MAEARGGRSQLYHHGDLAEALMEAAVREIAAHGTEKLSLRALARQAGVSSTAPYRHFESKTALLAALARRGFDDLHTHMRAADTGPDPAQRLLAVGRAYIEFALAHPVEYQLMFSALIGDFTEFEGLREAAELSYEVPLAIIEEGMAAGMFRRAPAIAHGAAMWSALHGVSSLLINMTDKTEQSEARALQSVQHLRTSYGDVLELLLRGISS